MAKKAPPKKGKRPAAAPKKRRRTDETEMALKLFLGVTVLAMLGGVAWMSTYMAERMMPKPEKTTNPDRVIRPKVEEKLTTKPLKRPGILTMAPDQIYYPQATDMTGRADSEPVAGMLERGIITIFPDGTFRPAEPTTRAEFSLWCYNAVMLQSVPGNDPFIVPKKALVTKDATGELFEDVDSEHWAASVIETLQSSAHFYGDKPPKQFRPDAPLKREEWALFATRFAAQRDQVLNLSKKVDDTKLAVAMRKLNLNDPDKIRAVYKPYVWFIVGDEKRKAWLEETFELPINPGPWEPQKPTTRGEAAVWVAGNFQQIGLAFQ